MLLYFVRTSKINGPYTLEQAQAFLLTSGGGELVTISFDLSALDSFSSEFAAVAVPVCSPQLLP
jgi:hypothetical protein